jgi:hypothetical protein
MKTLAILLVVLAVFISVIPQLTECQLHGHFMTLQNGRQVPMKCHWTARAELALGIPLLGVGTTMFFSRRKETQRFLGIIGAILGIFVILLPTAGLIGVCENPEMLCTTVMKPALILMGVLVTGASLAAIGISLGREKSPE